MNTVILFGKNDEFKIKINWCKEYFGPGPEVVGPTQAEIYRWSYEIIGFGLKQIYFTDEQDYFLYLLKWT